MSKIVLICAFLMASLAAGCTSVTREPLRTALPPLESKWMIKMTHSGGIMGLMRSIEVSSDGKYTVMDERSDKTITKKLSTNELSNLNEIISSSNYVTPERSGPSGCADCFNYDLEIQKGDGKRINIQVDDISMPNSEVETLITYLGELIDAALN